MKSRISTSSLSALMLMAVFTGISSCGGNNVNKSNDIAHQLFVKSTRTIEVYIDSIKNATDSAAFKRIVDNFNKKITVLNYEFPPDTDLLLNEEENDSLIRMHKRLVKAIERKDSILNISHADTIPTGNPSVSNPLTPIKPDTLKKP